MPCKVTPHLAKTIIRDQLLATKVSYIQMCCVEPGDEPGLFD